MSTGITLDEAKTHLRVDFDDEDGLLTVQLAAAEEAVSQYLGRPLPWADEAGASVPVPASVKAAVLLILGDLYAVREAQTERKLEENTTVKFLLAPYRVLAVA